MISRKALLRLAAAGLALPIAVGLAASAAHAQGQEKKTKKTQTEAKWVAFDAATKTVKVKVEKPGKGPNTKLMKKGTEVTFRVSPEGSVLARTTVKVNGKKGELTDIPQGKQVLVYWEPDSQNKEGFYASAIDVTFSEEELDKRYPDADAAEKAAQ
jgi:hypothetical protein